MSDSARDRFSNVRMPRWYRVTALVVRVVGFLVLVISGRALSTGDASQSAWPGAGLVLGGLLLVLPGLPKAYLEQRNRFRGSKEGSFQDFLDDEAKRRK